MQCNIDAKGKAARLTSGIITTVVGVVLVGLVLASIIPGFWGWPTAICVLIAGGFQIFEARAGWCVLRAMGIKTPV